MPTPTAALRRGECVLTSILIQAGVTIGFPIYQALRDGIGRLDGAVAVASGLEFPAAIRRDAMGIVTVDAGSLEDAAFAQGFAHAQDRIFQMDGSRRFAAGELAELVGPAGLSWDRSMRPLGLAAIATERLDELPQDQRRLLERYAEGVNEGIAHFATLPPEYGLLGLTPEPWQAADSLLVGLMMFDMLTFTSSFEHSTGILRAALPAEVAAFLTPETSRFDAPFDGAPLPPPLPIPGPEVVDLHAANWPDTTATLAAGAIAPMDFALGSNGWVVSGKRSATGSAMLASDMHLRLGVPNVWHRMELRWQAGSASGVTLPGVPGVIAGSNGIIAWSFTNSQADVEDLVRIEMIDAETYRTPEGPMKLDRRTESLSVRGGGSEEIQMVRTIWGPVLRTDWDGAPLALRWSADTPGGLDMGLLNLMQALTLEQGLRAAAEWAGPPQNVMIAGRDGRIGWTVSGMLPKRTGFDGSYPVSWADGSARWDGELSAAERPTVIDPPSGAIFTANGRPVGLDRSRLLGRSFALGDRALRIGEMLESLEGRRLSELDMLNMQLDTRTPVLDMARGLILEACDAHAPGDPRIARARELAEQWSGRADAADPAMHLVATFSENVMNAVLAPFVAKCREVSPRMGYRWPQSAEVVHRILEERPEHLLDPRYESWERLLVTQLDATLFILDDELGRPWAEVHPVRVRHPLSLALDDLGPLGSLLDMPEVPMGGSYVCVRVVGEEFGASERMVVSPGHEGTGILHMPGGQSGNPFSPTYRAGHMEWALGTPLPFAPGAAEHTLRLRPAGR